MLRENWSSTTISASLPRGVWAQWSSSPLRACSSTSAKRSVISLSTSGPPWNHHCIWRPNVSWSASKMSSSGNQYERTSSGLLTTISFLSVPDLRPTPLVMMPTYEVVVHPPNAPFLGAPSENSVMANFLELRKVEVRRIYLSGTPVNKPLQPFSTGVVPSPLPCD